MPNSFPKRTTVVLVVTGLFFICSFLTSCYTTKPYTYLQGPFDTASLSHIPVIEPVIRKGDILSIVVYSDNTEATIPYNQGGSVGALPQSSTGLTSGATTGTTGTTGGGYTVDEKGNIEMQGVGLLHVDGLKRSDLKDTLDGRLKDKYLKNPYYVIRFVNYHLTILGEVTKPGPVSIPGTQISLFEALGLAGDMTFYARRDNVLVIRDSLGKRTFGRLDVTKPEIMNSPYYYLQQGDIVIVEQTKKKIASNDQVVFRNVSLLASIVSVVVTVYLVFR